MKNVIILGLTGSIGSTAIKGCISFTDKIKVIGASVHSRIDLAVDICIKQSIPNLCITSSLPYHSSHPGVKIWRDLKEMLAFLQADIVLNGISGSPGLDASYSVIDSGSDLALANKESVVLAGSLLFEKARKNNVKIIPVDSEHSAIDELLYAHREDKIRSLIITASGGPFLNTPLEEMKLVSPQVAVKHPTWNMGPKISIDSSTLANKGLEVIEAHYLFGFSSKQIEVVVHPQSIVHSLIRTASGQIYAQLSPPDMAFPIMRALVGKAIDRQIGKDLDFSLLNLNFMKLDSVRFPFVQDAIYCVEHGASYCIAYNTADEVAVEAFMKGQIGFTDIRTVVRRVLDLDWSFKPTSLEDIHEIQRQVMSSVVLKL